MFFNSLPMLVKPMAKSWDFDVVFYGHNHIHNIEKKWDCLIVNPWEISTHKTGKATFAIYDTNNNSAEIIELKDYKNTKFEKVTMYREKIWFDYSSTKEHKY